jgi:hypothetical protein
VNEPKSIEILRKLSGRQQWRPELSQLILIVESLRALEDLETITKKTGLTEDQVLHITGQFGRWLSQSSGSADVAWYYEEKTAKLIPGSPTDPSSSLMVVIPSGFETSNRRGYKAIASIVWRNPDRKLALQFLSRSFVGRPIVLSQQILSMVHTFARFDRLGAPDPAIVKAKTEEINQLTIALNAAKEARDPDRYNRMLVQQEQLIADLHLYKEYHLEALVTSSPVNEISSRLAALLVKAYDLLEFYRDQHLKAVAQVLKASEQARVLNKSISRPQFSDADLAKIDLAALEVALIRATILAEIPMSKIQNALDIAKEGNRIPLAQELLKFRIRYFETPKFYSPETIADLSDGQVYRIAYQAGLIFNEDNKDDILLKKELTDRLRSLSLTKYLDELTVLGTNAARQGSLDDFWEIVDTRDESIDWVVQLENKFSTLLETSTS